MSSYNLPDDFSWNAFDRHFGDDLEPEQDEDEGYEPDINPDEGPDVDAAYDAWLCRQSELGEDNG